LRRGRLVMVSLPLQAIMPDTGRNSTYLSCSDFPNHLLVSENEKRLPSTQYDAAMGFYAISSDIQPA